MSKADKVRFVLKGANAGKTIGFSKDHVGNPRFQFVQGVMEVHPTRVNGRFIQRMKQEYGAYLEGEAHGGGEAEGDRTDPERGEEVAGDLSQGEEHPAAGDAVQLQGDGDPEPGQEGQPAEGRGGPRSKAPRRRKAKAE